MAQHNKTTGVQVLVDYKNTSSHLSEATETTRKPTHRYASPKESSAESAGNGRIRKSLALCAFAVIGGVAMEKVFSDGSPAPQPDKLAAVTASPANPLDTLESSIEIPEPETEFVFNANTAMTGATAPSDVPFVEVPEIDSLMNPTDVPIAAFTSPAPLTAANAELANDYTQEPSQILVKIKKGDSLHAVLVNHDLTHTEVANLTTLEHVNPYLTNLRPGDELELSFDGSRRLTNITREIDLEKTLHITRAADNQFTSKLDVQPLEKSIQVANLKLDSSLFVDGAAAGLSESMIMELYSIFQWTVDFNREVRAGDVVTVLYESFNKKGKHVKNGNILAAEYIASNSTHSAFRHVRNGQRTYFDANGQSLKKQFLRNPIKARITSRFNLKRKHPIRHTIRAHKGVDYGAPTGTAISAAGDGRVVFKGVRGGYGNTVEIQHGDRYTTLYAHLSRFPENLQQGSRIKQGQVIGYVGKSGLATGPHLHYEFRVDGIHHDPQKVKLPGSSPLEKSELVAFKQNIEPLRSQLASLRSEAESDTLAMR